MDINDKSVLEMLNKLIAIDRLNKTQILQMVNLVSISNDTIESIGVTEDISGFLEPTTSFMG